MARDRRRDDDDLDDEDERPRRRRRDEEDEDFEEDERPRKKLGRKKTGGSNKGLIIGLIVGGVALLGIVIALIFLLGGSSSPRKSFEAYAKAAEQKDFGGVYDGIDKKSQDLIGSLIQFVAMMDPKYQGKSGRELFVAVAQDNQNRAMPGVVPAGKLTVLSEKIDGNRATLQVKAESGREQSVTMVKEDGKWKVSLADMMPAMPKMPDFNMPKMPDFKMPDFPKLPKF